jgi:hypothetical protein
MRLIFFIVLIIVVLIAGWFIWGPIALKRKMEEIKPWGTYMRLMDIAEECDKYHAQFGKWPNSLAELQAGHPELLDPLDKDAWGRELVIIPYKGVLDYGEVISYGRDGKPGGTGDDKDLEVRFPTDANSNWNKQEGVGLKEP